MFTGSALARLLRYKPDSPELASLANLEMLIDGAQARAESLGQDAVALAQKGVAKAKALEAKRKRLTELKRDAQSGAFALVHGWDARSLLVTGAFSARRARWSTAFS